MLVPAIFTSRQELGMQPEFLYPRRSRFAPKLLKNMMSDEFVKSRIHPVLGFKC